MSRSRFEMSAPTHLVIVQAWETIRAQTGNEALFTLEGSLSFATWATLVGAST
jgi:hypothetical protein